MKYWYMAYDEVWIRYGVGDHYEERIDYRWEGERLESIEDARKELASLLDDLDEPYKVTRTKRGLDSVEYHTLGIERYVRNESDEWWEWDSGYEDLDAVVTIPDGLVRAMQDAQASYHAFLDYERPDYHGIED